MTALPVGSRLLNYVVEKILGQGGFGITYLALDEVLSRRVAIKEYFPEDLSWREDGRVRAKSSLHQDRFDHGKKDFLEEGRTLGRFKHPNIVRVMTFFEANGTAYLVMEFESGESLASLLTKGQTLDEQRLLAIALPLLTGLGVLHSVGMIHRDIKPGNIVLRADGSPVLLDFGAARQVSGSQTRPVTALLTPGYAPFEQYYSERDRQGPWSDIYAMAGVLYRGIAGRTPVESTLRSDALLRHAPDPMEPAIKVGAGRYSENFLTAVDQALHVLAADRPASCSKFAAMLKGEIAPQSRSHPPSAEVEGSETLEKDEAVTVPRGDFSPVEEEDSANTKTERHTEPDRRPPPVWWPWAAAALVVAVGGAWRLHDATPPPVLADYGGGSVAVVTKPGQPAKPPAAVAPGEATLPPNQPAKPPAAVAPGEATLPAVSSTASDSSTSSAAGAWQEPVTGMAFVFIAGGTYPMGCGDWAADCRSDEQPEHKVTVGGFWLGQFEVSQGQWAKVMGTTTSSPDLPVDQVSWNDTQTFMARLNGMGKDQFRLPTEAEWEFACRSGGQEQIFCGGDAAGLLAWTQENAQGQIQAIGKKTANALGLYDMSGNVGEWVEDWYCPGFYGLPEAAATDPRCSDGSGGLRAMRGGGANEGAEMARSTARSGYDPNQRLPFHGLRLVRVGQK